MLIQERVLHAIEAAEEHYGAGEYIFQELASPQFYYQIVTGEVKLNSYKEDGKEFIHSILGAEDGFWRIDAATLQAISHECGCCYRLQNTEGKQGTVFSVASG